ncbi:g10755 [Coccomyxa elongata]
MVPQSQAPPRLVPEVPRLNPAASRRPQPRNLDAATVIAPPVLSSRVIDDGKRKREAAPPAPAASAAKPGKKKPWWETEQGAGEVASVQEVYGGHRNADNTFAVNREIDEFEELGLLEPSVFQGDTKKKKRSKAPAPAQQLRASRQTQRLNGSRAFIPQSAQRALQPQAWGPPPATTAVPPKPIGPPPGLAPPPLGFAAVLARFSRV